MTQDGSGYTYTFDAENRLTKASGMSGGPYCYVYDGNGLRVAKKSGANSDCSGGTVVKLYWRSLSGDALAETDGSGSTTNSAYNEYVFFAGRRIARRDSGGNVNYLYSDQIGSITTMTDGNGNACYQSTFTPYGEEHATQTNCSTNYKFTGYERDASRNQELAKIRALQTAARLL